MTPEELYNATSYSWVASFGRTESRDLKYYCAVYQNRIIEVYDFEGYEEEIPKRKPTRYFLKGHVSREEMRNDLIGKDVSSIHKGKGNPIKYTRLSTLLSLESDGVPSGLDETVEEMLESVDFVNHVYSYITSGGFCYSLSNIMNLYLSLRSKPFVIISGISGTGKTKIVQLFAESIGATEDSGQFKLIPVRPDWSDSSELLGYVDLKGDFKKGPLTEMIEHALDHPNLPHFVLLDEMNLARVEYYFSDLLSVMESRRRDGDEIISSTLLDEKYMGRSIGLPENLYVIGTVNMDETTHPFSKKVLDRANTIEFNEVDLNNFDFLEGSDETVDPIHVTNDQLKPTFITLKDIYSTHMYLIQKVSQKLDDINRKLELINAQVGYRVRDEICFYMVHSQDGGLLDEEEAFDLCIMQKVLPRITGGDSRIELVLQQLYEQFTGISFDATNVQASVDYPRSTKKIVEMLRRYQTDGFTSFWIS
ncbi:AAA family ATPase [Saccharococcus sp. Marseille-Q5394]|uniref:AAA family ATPase n=1 Tax=Saccharococcus sp. Marseille-Q5394 TaxID=2972778 RepID=UPI0021C8BAA6|nr:AAA family ATPase [Saccharococcus sp. Marseille-Q5394]